MPNTEHFRQVFDELKSILEPYAAQAEVERDTDEVYFLNSRQKDQKKRPIFFGAVTVKKSYVSFHLMPVYVNPALLNDLSPELKKHMHGKSCFNFSRREPALFSELDALTAKAHQDYVERKMM